jgi:hypothetical protein
LRRSSDCTPANKSARANGLGNPRQPERSMNSRTLLDNVSPLANITRCWSAGQRADVAVTIVKPSSSSMSRIGYARCGGLRSRRLVCPTAAPRSDE